MIYIVTALYCEAKCLIQYYHLTKMEGSTRFQVFYNEEQSICLLITGTGSLVAAVAVASVCTAFGAGEGDFLVNCGICAGGKEQLGRLFLCNKLQEESTGRTFYPDILYRHDFEEKMIITGTKILNAENIDAGVLYDLEAAAVYQAGSYFFGPHQMSFLKVVSDSGNGSGVSKEKAEQLTTAHLEEITAYITKLRCIQQNQNSQKTVLKEEQAREIEKLCDELRCSKVMELSLKQYLKYCMLAEIDYNMAVKAMYQEGSLPCHDKREGKKRLEELKRRLL